MTREKPKTEEKIEFFPVRFEKKEPHSFSSNPQLPIKVTADQSHKNILNFKKIISKSSIVFCKTYSMVSLVQSAILD